MRIRPIFLGVLCGVTFASIASAAPSKWTRVGTPARTTITGGPWTLGQGPATVSDPTAGYPSPNPGTNAFAPYYFPLTSGDDVTLTGIFDYRPKSLEEAIVSAFSTDGGKTWTFAEKVLDFEPNTTIDFSSGNDDGQGHPFVITFGSHTYLYTLDRTPSAVDAAGLLVHEIHPTTGHPLDGAPASETPIPAPGASGSMRTTGLLNPDAIFGVIPGATSSAVQILYVQKVVDATDATKTTTTLRKAESSDGLSWTDLGATSGLTDATTIWIGPRGTIFRYDDGRFGLFFSGGLLADGDSDAFHYIGYAESSDATSFTVVNGASNPLFAIDATDPSGAPQTWYQSRVYDPSVTFDTSKCHATMIFAGYNPKKPKANPGDYRQIGVADLTRDCTTSTDAGVDASTTIDAAIDSAVIDSGKIDSGATTTDASTSTDSGASSGDAGDSTSSTGSSGGCAFGASSSAFSPFALALLALLRRRRH